MKQFGRITRITDNAILGVIIGVAVPCVIAFACYFALAWLWALNKSDSGSIPRTLLTWKRLSLFELSVVSLFMIYLIGEGILWVLASYTRLARRHAPQTY